MNGTPGLVSGNPYGIDAKHQILGTRVKLEAI